MHQALSMHAVPRGLQPPGGGTFYCMEAQHPGGHFRGKHTLAYRAGKEEAKLSCKTSSCVRGVVPQPIKAACLSNKRRINREQRWNYACHL